MGWQHVLAGEWTVFDFRRHGRTVRVRAKTDPRVLGLDDLRRFLGGSSAPFLTLLDGMSKFTLMPSMRGAPDMQALVFAWRDAVGLSADLLAALQLALDYPDEVEQDFLRLYPHHDVADWLEGRLSTRRFALMVFDLFDRPDSRVGALAYGIKTPLSHTEIMVAQSVAASNERTHPFLVTHKELQERAERDAKIQRMRDRGLSAS